MIDESDEGHLLADNSLEGIPSTDSKQAWAQHSAPGTCACHLGRGTCGKYIGCHAEAGCPAHYKNVDQESLIDDSQTGLKQNLKNT